MELVQPSAVIILNKQTEVTRVMTKSASPSYQEPEVNVAGKKVLPPSKARAGLMDRNTLYMLIASTVLTLLFFGAIFFLFISG